jgi:hypothetical protein
VTLPKPVIAYSTQHRIATVTGIGFQRSSPITVTYHGVVIAHARSAADGSVAVSFRQPARLFRHGQLVVTDRLGNRSSLVLINPRLRHSVAHGRVTLHGSGYPPGALVTVLYHGRLMTSTRAGMQGSISVSFTPPPGAKPGWLLEVRDTANHYTTVIQMGHRR